MCDIEIRTATENDVDALVGIVKRYRDFQGVKGQDINEIKAFIAERLANSEAVIFIAISKITNTIIGFVQLYPTFSTVSLQKQWLLNDFYVDEKERNNGIGSVIMSAIKEHFRGKAKGFILVAAKTNSGAKRFYEKQGWKTDVFDFYFYFYETDA